MLLGNVFYLGEGATQNQEALAWGGLPQAHEEMQSLMCAKPSLGSRVCSHIVLQALARLHPAWL